MSLVQHGSGAPLDLSDLDVFEVDDDGTLTPYDEPGPETHADIYGVLSISEGCSADDLIDEIQTAADLVCCFQTIASDAAGDMTEQAEALGRRSARRHELLELAAAIDDDPDDGWRVWLKSLNEAGLSKARQAIATWLDAPINWDCIDDFPSGWDPQEQVLRYFEKVDAQTLEALGVELIHGEHPGSTYYAARLKGDLHEANQRAVDLGVAIRFVAEGGTLEEIDPSPREALRRALTARFFPLFGRVNAQAMPSPLEALCCVPVQLPDVPPPPEGLRCAHDAAAFREWWQRALGALREPVEVWEDDEGNRHLFVLGGAVFSAGPEGEVQGWLWDPAGDDGLALTHEMAVSVSPLPWRWLWLGAWMKGLSIEVGEGARRRGTPLARPLIQQYVAWVMRVFRRRIARSCDMAQARRVIARELRLEPAALMVARRGDPIRCRPYVSAPEYNRALRHLAAQTQLRQDAPALAGLFHLMCDEDGFPVEGEPVQRLRNYLRAKGVSERGWRVIAGSGPRLLEPLRKRHGQQDAAGVLAYLQLLDRLGWRLAPSRVFMNRLLDAFASDAVPGPYLRQSVRQVPRTLQRVVDWFEASDECVRADIIKHLPVLVGWLAMGGAHAMAAIARHPGWQATLRRAREWEQRVAITADNADPWGLADLPHPDGEFDVRFLRTTRALYDEGKRMRHCVFDYAADCVLGQRAVASIRRRSSGRRVATVMYLFDGEGWSIEELHRSGNREVSDEIYRVAIRATPTRGSHATRLPGEER